MVFILCSTASLFCGVMVLSAPPLDDGVSASIYSLFVLYLLVWSVGNTACCLRDPHQGAPPSSGLQHPSVPQG